MPYEEPDIFDYEREKADHLSSPLVTVGMADREYATELGAERPECAWIWSDRDVCYANPYYKGPPVPYPED